MDENMANNPQVEEFTIENYIYMINRKKWFLIIITLLVLIGGMLYTNSKTRMYMSTCQIYTNRDTGSKYSDDLSLMSLSALSGLSTYSTEMIQKLITDPDNLAAAVDRLSEEEYAKGFNSSINPNNVEVIESEGSNMYNIEVTSMDPDVSAKLANAIAYVYFDSETETYNSYSEIAKEQILREINRILIKVEELRTKLSKLKQDTGIYSLDADLQSKISNKYASETQINTAKVELASLEQELSQTEKLYNSTPAQIKTNTATSISNSITISARLDQLTTDRNTLLQKFLPNSPEIKEIDKKIAFEEAKLKKAENANNDSLSNTYTITDNPKKQELKAKIDELKIQISAKKVSISKLEELMGKEDANLDQTSANEKEFTKLTEDYEILKENLAILQSNYYKLAFNSKSDYNIGRVISKAVPNRVPVDPNLQKSFVIFLIGGLVLGFFAVILADNLDNVVYDEKSLKKITTLPCLSKIPLITNTNEQFLKIGKLTGHSNFLESFRIFRNNIMLTEIMSESQGIVKNKSFAITGPDAKQGKSTVSANLAIAMALDGNKVLLVDADLRKPNVARFFNIPNDVGYTTLLKGITDFDKSISATNVENLYVLPSGPLPPNPAEFLNSNENRDLIRKLNNMYDVVIFDTSPCTFISDAQIVSTFVDAVVLVVTEKISKIPNVKNALEQLSLINAPVIGYVLNKVAQKKSHSSYYYNYYYYSTDDKD